MRKPKTIISIVCMFVFAVICGTHTVAQEYGSVDDRIMDFYKRKNIKKRRNYWNLFLTNITLTENPRGIIRRYSFFRKSFLRNNLSISL